MAQIIIPVAKLLYVCDDVVRDPHSGKVSVLNLWENVRVTNGGFPYELAKICVFAQFRGGSGDIPFHLEIAPTDSAVLFHERIEFVLGFRDRMKTHYASIKLHNVVFPAAGMYVVELYCNQEFVDDQPIEIFSDF